MPIFDPVVLVILRQVSVGSETMKALADLPQIRDLGIVECKIDTGFAQYLSSLKHLNYVSLYGSPVQERDVRDLCSLSSLHTLVLTGTGVAKELLDDLRRGTTVKLIYESTDVASISDGTLNADDGN